MRRSVAAALLLIVCALVAPASSARAYCRMTTSTRAPTPTMPCVTAGIPLAWHRPCSEIAFVSGEVSLDLATVTDIFDRSFTKWETVACDGTPPGFDVRMLTNASLCDRAEYNRDGRNVQTMVFVADGDWEPRGYDSNAYAVTTVWHNTGTGEIYDVDMEINEGRGPYGLCDATAGCTDGTVDLENVITHEAGHYFGMGHTPDSTVATMYAISPPGEVIKRILKDDDIQGFCAAYGGGVLPSDCDYNPRGGLKLTCGEEDGGCNCTTIAARPTSRVNDGGAAAGSAGLAAVAMLAARRRRRQPR